MPLITITTASTEKRVWALKNALVDSGIVDKNTVFDVDYLPQKRQHILTFLANNKRKVKTWLSNSNYAATIKT